MKKKLVDLQLEIPCIDISETKKLFGGLGGYDDPPGKDPFEDDRPVGEPQPVDPDPIQPAPLDIDELLGEDFEPMSREEYEDSIRNENDDRKDDDQKNNDRDDNDRDDNDRDDDRKEENSNSDRDRENDREEDQEQNNVGGGNHNTNHTQDNYLGNPHNPNKFPATGDTYGDDKNLCVPYAILQVLKYFNAYDANIDSVLGKIQSTLGSGINLDQGLSPADSLKALGAFFSYTVVSNLAGLNAALGKGNVLLASVKDANASEEAKANNADNHFVVLVGYNSASGSFVFYDPQLGKLTSSSDPYYGKITHFAEITGFEPYYERDQREKQDAAEQEEQQRHDREHGKDDSDLVP